MTSAKRVTRPATAAPRSRNRVSEGLPETADVLQAKIRYVETSALLAAWLEGDASAQRALRGPGRLITSSLTHAEASRAVLRAQLARRVSPSEVLSLTRGLQAFAERCETVAVSDEVIRRVGRAFPVEPVRTLDAIHLATVELLGQNPAAVTVVTRDARVRANAIAMGWETE